MVKRSDTFQPPLAHIPIVVRRGFPVEDWRRQWDQGTTPHRDSHDIPRLVPGGAGGNMGSRAGGTRRRTGGAGPAAYADADGALQRGLRENGPRSIQKYRNHRQHRQQHQRECQRLRPLERKARGRRTLFCPVPGSNCVMAQASNLLPRTRQQNHGARGEAPLARGLSSSVDNKADSPVTSCQRLTGNHTRGLERYYRRWRAGAAEDSKSLSGRGV